MCTEKQPYIQGEKIQEQSKPSAPRNRYKVYPTRVDELRGCRIVVPPEIPFGEYLMRVAEDYSQVTYLPAPAETSEKKYRISKRSSGKRGVVKSIKIDDHFCGKELSPVVHKDGSFSYITPEKYQEILQQVRPLVASIVPIAVPVIALDWKANPIPHQPNPEGEEERY